MPPICHTWTPCSFCTTSSPMFSWANGRCYCPHCRTKGTIHRRVFKSTLGKISCASANHAFKLAKLFWLIAPQPVWELCWLKWGRNCHQRDNSNQLGGDEGFQWHGFQPSERLSTTSSMWFLIKVAILAQAVVGGHLWWQKCATDRCSLWNLGQLKMFYPRVLYHLSARGYWP